jgi:cytosine deaminase
MAPPDQIVAITKLLFDTGVALTVLPATDLFLMGRDQDYRVHQGGVPAHRLIPHGVTCSLSSNNILNPFTPFGDGSLIRMANMFANIAQASKPSEIRDCFETASIQSAQLLRRDDYGIAAGNPADIVVFNAGTSRRRGNRTGIGTQAGSTHLYAARHRVAPDALDARTSSPRLSNLSCQGQH